MPVKVLLSPQFSTQEITYQVDGETLTATVDGQSDSFNLAQLADEGIPEEGIETSLPVQPIVAIERDENGQIAVTLLKFITLHATHAQRFPVPTLVENGAQF